MTNQNPQSPRVSTQRILIVMAAIFLIGIAIGLLLYPSIGNPNAAFNGLMFFSAILILLSGRWECRA